MDTRHKVSIAVAPLAVAGIACAWIAFDRVGTPGAKVPPALAEHCQRAAELLWDVSWAAACFKAADSNDCMLPDAQAARVNAILANEEARCVAAESQASASR